MFDTQTHTQYNGGMNGGGLNGIDPKIFIPAVLIFMLVFFAIAIPSCHGAIIEERQAIDAIIGEASGEGYYGMLCVASALRNRGTLRGVYGVRARHVAREPRWVRDLARKAWRESVHKNVVNGATHWESIKFKVPYWAKKMKVVYRYKNHVFYKS
jgi:hypothetical protein